MTYYFAQNATIEVREPGTSKFKVVGAAQEVSIDTEFEVEELYQFGSILRTTAARHHASINVKVSTAQFGSFDTDAAWFWKILNSAGVSEKQWTPYDGTARTIHEVSISDTTNLPMFSIAGEWVSDDGSETIYGRADGVYFKNFSWGGGLGEYIIEELEGTGSQVTFTTDKAYAAGGSEANWADVSPRIETQGIESITTAGTSALIKLERANSYTHRAFSDISGLKFQNGNHLVAGEVTNYIADVGLSDSNGMIDCFTVVAGEIGEDGLLPITITHVTPTVSGAVNPAGTAILNIVCDGISKQIPIQFTTDVEHS